LFPFFSILFQSFFDIGANTIVKLRLNSVKTKPITLNKIIGLIMRDLFFDGVDQE